ncbi:MAG TPA: cation:proton antiporter [Casimicrobiaceae bacterium]|nr:cation:proton antiporter [Casimicrobiaceae bacterium]
MPGQADLLTNIGLCVSAAAVLAILAHRLRQPPLLAYLIAGVLIGPEIGFGFISEKESIRTVAEIGLILLLFIIGLEMDLKKLLAAGKPVLVAGLLQFPLCVAIGLACFLPFEFRGSGVGLLYLAVCLALSSTMIVVKLLYDKFELDTLPGRITLGVLVFQDVWAILFLAIQPNLLHPELGALLASLFKGILLVAVSLLVSKTLLPRIFQSVAKVPELVLIGSLAWCFIVSAVADAADLSPAMGALIAGISISTFPYNIDVVAKVISIRDFFVTLFFVALGMRIPMPTVDVIRFAAIAAAFLVLSRFVVVFPLLRALRLGHRASLLPSINLAQMSEFSMVIAAIGLGDGHIEERMVSALIFVFALTSVTSTYMIEYSHQLQALFGGWLRRVGFRDLDDLSGAPADSEQHKDVVLLGFFVEASALVHEYELEANDGPHPVLDRLLVIDFNPEVHAELRRRNIACVYGDISHMETLRHADIEEAALIVSTVPDTVLKGTDNLELLRKSRRLCPRAKVIVTAGRTASALDLYEAGADYVFMPRLQSSAQMAAILVKGLERGFDDLREGQVAHLRQRKEVLQ